MYICCIYGEGIKTGRKYIGSASLLSLPTEKHDMLTHYFYSTAHTYHAHKTMARNNFIVLTHPKLLQ